MQLFRTPLAYFCSKNPKPTTMNKIKEFLIKVLDEGEATSIKDMKKPSFKISKWLFITTSLIIPITMCILASFVMNVDSREFTLLSFIPLFNCQIVWCWILFRIAICFKK